jgi:putative endonuclease
MSSQKFYVYILTNQNRTVLYTGVTNDLEQRIIEHYQNRGGESFTGRYFAHLLLFYEARKSINDAIDREKEIKGWVRKKKWALINEFNPEVKFLNEELFGQWPPRELTSRI